MEVLIAPMRERDMSEPDFHRAKRARGSSSAAVSHSEGRYIKYGTIEPNIPIEDIKKDNSMLELHNDYLIGVPTVQPLPSEKDQCLQYMTTLLKQRDQLDIEIMKAAKKLAILGGSVREQELNCSETALLHTTGDFSQQKQHVDVANCHNNQPNHSIPACTHIYDGSPPSPPPPGAADRQISITCDATTQSHSWTGDELLAMLSNITAGSSDDALQPTKSSGLTTNHAMNQPSISFGLSPSLSAPTVPLPRTASAPVLPRRASMGTLSQYNCHQDPPGSSACVQSASGSGATEIKHNPTISHGAGATIDDITQQQRPLSSTTLPVPATVPSQPAMAPSSGAAPLPAAPMQQQQQAMAAAKMMALPRYVTPFAHMPPSIFQQQQSAAEALPLHLQHRPPPHPMMAAAVNPTAGVLQSQPGPMQMHMRTAVKAPPQSLLHVQHPYHHHHPITMPTPAVPVHSTLPVAPRGVHPLGPPARPLAALSPQPFYHPLQHLAGLQQQQHVAAMNLNLLGGLTPPAGLQFHPHPRHHAHPLGATTPPQVNAQVAAPSVTNNTGGGSKDNNTVTSAHHQQHSSAGGGCPAAMPLPKSKHVHTAVTAASPPTINSKEDVSAALDARILHCTVDAVQDMSLPSMKELNDIKDIHLSADEFDAVLAAFDTPGLEEAQSNADNAAAMQSDEGGSGRKCDGKGSDTEGDGSGVRA